MQVVRLGIGDRLRGETNPKARCRAYAIKLMLLTAMFNKGRVLQFMHNHYLKNTRSVGAVGVVQRAVRKVVPWGCV